MKHKHCEVIKAWAEGKVVQVRTHDGRWIDCVFAPRWDIADSFRVKPETVRYRVGLLKPIYGSSYCTHVADNAGEAREIMSNPSFVRWLGDWQEVEV